MPSSELDLAAIEAREKAATPGPWSADPTGSVCADVDLRSDARGETILPQVGPMEVAECYRSESPGERGNNAEFIAHARTDVPSLLAKVAELQGRVDELTGQVEGRDETIQRVRDLAAKHPRDPKGFVSGWIPAAHVIAAIDGDPADDGSQTNG